MLNEKNNISQSLTLEWDMPDKNSVVSWLCEVAQQDLHLRWHLQMFKVSSLGDLGLLGNLWEQSG